MTSIIKFIQENLTELFISLGGVSGIAVIILAIYTRFTGEIRNNRTDLREVLKESNARYEDLLEKYIALSDKIDKAVETIVDKTTDLSQTVKKEAEDTAEAVKEELDKIIGGL